MAITYLYIMGAGSGAGKSTVCMGILAQLLQEGFVPEQLAYIKPVTQCVTRQPVALFCEKNHIPCLDIGPVVFKNGFSKACIADLTSQSGVLLAEVVDSIRNLAKAKSIVIVDGVGHPAVGSVVGVSTVDVALALPGRVLFVGKPGIGAALDNTVLCLTFMHTKGLSNIGIIYNNILPTAINEVKAAIVKRLPELVPTVTLLGFVIWEPAIDKKPSADIARWFTAHIDWKALLAIA